MAMEITFPGGVAVTAEHKGFVIPTDQPEASGGNNNNPSPYDLFLASLGTCAGFFALRFIQQRGLSTEGLNLTLDTVRNPETKRLDLVRIEIRLPEGFPEKYRNAVIKSVDQCAVKRVMLDPPEFEVETV